MNKEFISHSEQETYSIAYDFAQSLAAGTCIAYTGDLGAGKTAFTRGLAAGLGYTGDVSSPTFAIVNEYRGGRLTLYHYDMYRITGPDDLETTGFYDALEDPQGVVAAEWSENISDCLPELYLQISIETIDVSTRRILVTERRADF